MGNIPIGLQLYSVKTEAAQDLPAVIAQVAQMGYAGVEFAGYHGHSAQDIRKMLDANGLQCCGSHTRLDTLFGDTLDATIEFNQIIGNKYLIVPSLPQDHTTTREGWLEAARLLNEVAARLQPHGMYTGYHNHSIEFQPLPGETELPWDIFFGNTNPEVIMQFDTGNAMHGGSDAPPFLERYPGRARTVHLKEYSRGPKGYEVLIGEGDVPWQQIFTLCETVAGTEWYIVEQEGAEISPLEAVDACLKALRAMGK